MNGSKGITALFPARSVSHCNNVPPTIECEALRGTLQRYEWLKLDSSCQLAAHEHAVQLVWGDMPATIVATQLLIPANQLGGSIPPQAGHLELAEDLVLRRYWPAGWGLSMVGI